MRFNQIIAYHVLVCMCVYIYIYIYILGEGERGRGRDGGMVWRDGGIEGWIDG